MESSTRDAGARPAPAPDSGSPSLLTAALLALLAVAVRLVYAWESAASPFYDAPVVDARRFVDQARAIAGGDWLGGSEVFWHPPLYPYLLALLDLLFAAGFFTAARVVQALLAGGSCLILYYLAVAAARTGGEQAAPSPARVGALAAGAYALYGPAIYFDGELLAVSLEVFLYLGLLAVALAAARGGGRWTLILLGLVAGLSALTRPTILAFAAVLLAWLARHRRCQGRSWGHVLGAVGVPAALPLVLVVLAVTWRNWAVGHDLVMISSNGGVNLYIGTNAAYDSTVAIRPDTGWEDLVAEPDAHGAHRPSQRSAYFARRAAAWAVGHPLDYAVLLARKAYLLASGPEIKRNQDVYYGRQHSRLLAFLLWDWGVSFPFGVIGPLAWLGLATTWRRRQPALALLRLFCLTYGAAVILFFVTARYRLPLVPALLFFASWSACDLVARVRHGGWRASAAPLVALAALALWLNLPAGSDPDRDPQLYHDLGEVWLRKGQYARAADLSARALDLDPAYLSARHNLAVALLQQGRPQLAAAEAERVLQARPRRPDTLTLLGRACLAMGDRQRAAAQFQRALELEPLQLEANHDLGRLLYDAGAYRAALPHLEEAARQLPADFWCQYELGRAYQQAGQLAAARQQFSQAYAAAPRPEALNALGVAWLQEDRPDLAAATFQRALALDPASLPALQGMAAAAAALGDSAAARQWRGRLQKLPDPP
ncbi:MAG: tetratricopeptide repeat protein [Gemmatimonadota bacterium]